MSLAVTRGSASGTSEFPRDEATKRVNLEFSMEEEKMTQSLKCLDDETLYKFIDNQLHDKQRKQIEHHLNECSTCRTCLKNIIQLFAAPITDEEKVRLESIEQIPIETRLEKILGHKYKVKTEQIASNTGKVETRKSVSNIKHFVETIKIPHFEFRPKIAFAVLVLLGVGSIGFRFYNTEYQIHKAMKIVEEYYKTPRNDLRLSGSYSSSDRGALMGDEEKPAYINNAQQKLDKARKFGSHSSEMRTALSHIYIISQEYSKADSILLSHDIAHSASALNDLGVSAYKQGHSDQALDYFHRALSIEPNRAQTLYNVGLVFFNQGKVEQALPYFEKCINCETDPEWRKMIQNKIDLKM